MKKRNMDARQAAVILHPVRLRILTTLAGRRLTTGQIAAALPDVPQATLYRHVGRLESAGVLAVAEQRPVRGTVEKVYVLVEGGGNLTPEDIGQMSADDWEAAFGAFATSLLGQFAVYLRRPDADPAADGVGFRTVPVFLSTAELEQFAADLRAVLLPLLDHGPTPGRRRRLLSTILMPDPQPDDQGETP